MVKRSLAKIMGITGGIVLLITGIFLYEHEAIVSTPMGGHRYFSYSAASFQNPEGYDKAAYGIDQARLWGVVHFPVDDYDGLELGRKIGSWIVKEIQNKKCDN